MSPMHTNFSTSPLITSGDESFISSVQRELARSREGDPMSGGNVNTAQSIIDDIIDAFQSGGNDKNDKERYTLAVRLTAAAIRIGTEGDQMSEYSNPNVHGGQFRQPASAALFYSADEACGWYITTRHKMKNVSDPSTIRVVEVHDPYQIYDGPDETGIPAIKSGPYRDKNEAITAAGAADSKVAGPGHLAIRLGIISD